MDSLKPASPRPSPRNSPRPSPRASPRPAGGRSPLSKPYGSLPTTPKSAVSSGLTPMATRPSSPRTTAAAFNKLLDDDYPVYRSAEDVKEGLKRLRSMILADGIPAKVVCIHQPACLMLVTNVIQGPRTTSKSMEDSSANRQYSCRTVP